MEIEQEPETDRRTRQRANLVGQWMQSQEIPEHHRQQMQDLAEWIESPAAAQAMSTIKDNDDDIEQDRDKRIERRRNRRARRLAEQYQQQYGIAASVWISLSVYVLRALIWWLRSR